MKKVIFGSLGIAMALTVVLVACKKDAKLNNFEHGPVSACIACNGPVTLPNVIATGTNRVLSPDTLYLLDGKTYVDSGATITIKPGTRIEGVSKSDPDSASALVITRFGKIMASGKTDSVIVFTSHESTPSVGDWGGVVILGNAQINQTNSPIIEGIDQPSVPSGIDVTFGRTDSTLNGESSGILKYVQILYAGAAISPDNELNSLTMGGVGRGTVFSYVELAYGADDGVEFFGGTVNGDHLVVISNNDDQFDFDFGYTGHIQFALGVRGSGFTYNDANGIEADNDGSGSSATPRTHPVLSNMTLIGGEFSAFSGTLNGNRWRRNVSLDIRNSIIMGYNNGVSFESTGTIADAANFSYNLVHGFTTVSTGSTLASSNDVQSTSSASNTAIGLYDPFALGTSSYSPVPTGSSPAVSGANFTGLTGFTTVTYRGAFEEDADISGDFWIDGWTVGLLN